MYTVRPSGYSLRPIMFNIMYTSWRDYPFYVLHIRTRCYTTVNECVIYCFNTYEDMSSFLYTSYVLCLDLGRGGVQKPKSQTKPNEKFRSRLKTQPPPIKKDGPSHFSDGVECVALCAGEPSCTTWSTDDKSKICIRYDVPPSGLVGSSWNIDVATSAF
jgi:hypothetical protein